MMKVVAMDLKSMLCGINGRDAKTSYPKPSDQFHSPMEQISSFDLCDLLQSSLQ